MTTGNSRAPSRVVKLPKEGTKEQIHDESILGATATAGNEAAATAMGDIEQCPNCALLLARNYFGAYCVCCGFPQDKKRPTRPSELDEYLGRLRRGTSGADAQGLISLASRFGLLWGSPELKPAPRRLRLRDASGPALAIQETIQSDRYLVVVCGEALWPTGLVHFFNLDEETGQRVTRVRLLREAIGELDGSGNLECRSAGALEAVARQPVERVPPPPVSQALTEPAAQPSAQPRRQTRWMIRAAFLACMLAAVMVVLAVKKIVSAPSGPAADLTSDLDPASVTFSPPATGSLEVRTNCPALGNLDGLVLPQSRKQRSLVLEWNNQPARSHRLKVICDGFEDYTENVSLQNGGHTVLRVSLRRR